MREAQLLGLRVHSVHGSDIHHNLAFVTHDKVAPARLAEQMHCWVSWKLVGSEIVEAACGDPEAGLGCVAGSRSK